MNVRVSNGKTRGGSRTLGKGRAPLGQFEKNPLGQFGNSIRNINIQNQISAT